MPHHGRCAPSAVLRTATDGPRRRRIPGSTRAAEPGVHPRVPGCGPRVVSRAAGRAGQGGSAGGQGGCPGERDGGRAEQARVARAFTAGVPGPGHPGEYGAALLVSELFASSVRHSGSSAAGETVTVAVRAAGGVVRVEVTDRGGSGVPQLRACGSEAEDGRGLGPGGGTGRAVGAATRRADGDLVRAAARLWPTPRPAAGPGTGSQAGRAGVRGTSTPGICQVCPGTSTETRERAASTSPAARASASPRAGNCRRRPPPSSAHLRLNIVRELPHWHRHPDMLPRTVINAQDSRQRSRAYRLIRTHGLRVGTPDRRVQISQLASADPGDWAMGQQCLCRP